MSLVEMGPSSVEITSTVPTRSWFRPPYQPPPASTCLPSSPNSPISKPHTSPSPLSLAKVYELRLTVKHIVHPSAWSETLARCILKRIERALHNGLKMGPALKEAFDKAVASATSFACDHPVYATLVAIGILVLLLLWVVKVLGFSELGLVLDIVGVLSYGTSVWKVLGAVDRESIRHGGNVDEMAWTGTRGLRHESNERHVDHRPGAWGAQSSLNLGRHTAT